MAIAKYKIKERSEYMQQSFFIAFPFEKASLNKPIEDLLVLPENTIGAYILRKIGNMRRIVFTSLAWVMSVLLCWCRKMPTDLLVTFHFSILFARFRSVLWRWMFYQHLILMLMNFGLKSLLMVKMWGSLKPIARS